MGNFDNTRWFYTIFKMDVTIWLSVLLAVITLGTPASSSEPRVVCYYTNWSVYRPGTARFNPQNINPYLCTHLIYAFGGFTKDNSLKPFDKYQDIEKGGYAKFTGLKTYNKNLKTMLAIGGWNEGSTRFSPMVASRERRKEFVRNALKFLRQNRFDGLDLDWEYPAFRDGGKPKDRENYAKLVRELREEFDRESEKTGKPRLLLTMAVPAGIEYIQKGFDVRTLNQYLDWMNLLTYDYHSAFEPAVNHHAPLFPLEEPNEYSVDNELNIDYTIKFYLESGADADKLVLGIPTYGRSYTLFNPDAVEIGSPADGPGDQGDATREKGYLAYYEICEALKPKQTKKRRQASEEDSEEYSDEEDEEDEPWTVMHPNSDAMGPVAHKGNQWVGYDDVDIVKKKAEYVAENGLGGIMFWSIDNDDFRGSCHDKPYPLIEAAKEAYFQRIGSSDNAIAQKPKSSAGRPNRRKSKPKSTTTTTTPRTTTKANKRTTSTTPAWNIITPEPPTTPDPGSDFKCVDEGFFPHPRDCKKYFWCLDSGPSNLGIVAHQFTCPSGLYFNKAADSCDFARNVPCKKPEATTKAPSTKAPTTKTTSTTTTTTTTTTRRPIRLSTKSSSLFRTTSSTTTTPAPESEEEYKDVEPSDEDAEDPKVIKELIDLIKKVGGIEQLEKQLRFGEIPASRDGAITTTPSPFSKKLYQKVLEKTRGRNKYSGNSIFESSGQNSRRGPQNAGLEPSNDRDKLLRRDRPQYTTINRQRASTTEAPLESEEDEEEVQEEEQQVSRAKSVEARPSVATTAKPLQYVNIRRGKPTTSGTSDTADDTASRNALFERAEPFVTVSNSPNSLDILASRRENVPEYVTIRRQRPTTEETTTAQYQSSEEEVELQETALEREISTQPQYSTIIRSRSTLPPEEPSSEAPEKRIRSTTLPTETPSSPDPTTVLAVQISSLLNSPSSSEIESPEPETPAPTTEAVETTTLTSTTTTTTTVRPSASPPRRTNLIKRRGSTTTATPAASSTSTQAAKRNFLRRTKATAPPETTEVAPTDNTETTTNRFTRRGNSKFKTRKELEKTVEKNEIENSSRRPSLNGGARRNERPSIRKTFVSRRRPGGANASTAAPVSSTTAASTQSSTTRRGFRIASRRRPALSSTTIAPTTTTTQQPTTSSYEDEESLQEIGDTDAIEDPTLEPRPPKNSYKIQRRPLTSLKDVGTDQNPSATNEEENKRQSKKYSASIKQNQLDDLVKKSQEESSTERKTTVEDFSPETAVAIAAHQLITAPIPIVTDFEEDDVKPTRKSQTTVEYKFTSREYNEYSDSRTPTYDGYQSTPIYKISTIENDETTAYKTQSNFESTKDSDFDVPKTTLNKYPSTPEYKTIDYTDLEGPRISTYDVPKSTIFPNTANTATNNYIRTTVNDYTASEYESPKMTPTAFVPNSPSTNVPTNTATNPEYTRTTFGEVYTNGQDDFEAKLLTYLPKSTATNTPTNTITQEYISTGNTYPETSTEFVTRNSPSYVPKFTATTYPNAVNQDYGRTTDTNTFDSTLTEVNLSKISTTLSPLPTQNFESTTATLTANSPRTAGSFRPRSTEASRFRGKGFRSDVTANVVTAGYTGIQRGSSRFRTDKPIPVPVEDSGYSTVGYTGSSQEPSYFTREYLLESPVTKTYDEEYQYLSPITTPQTPTPPITRKIIRKKVHRKISTTQSPTTSAPPPVPSSSTTIKPRRGPPKPFEKVTKIPKKTYRPIASYDYYDDSDEKVAVKYVDTKVVMHENGNIECLDIGNFPHPTSCKKFISCARIENGSLLGWEYICPKGLSFDPVGGICNWSAGLGCNEKDA